MTTTIWTTFPLMVLPALVILLATITAMYAGTVFGGAGLLPGLVVHVPPQYGGSLLNVAAKPLKALGAGPPESALSVAHCAPHQVMVTGVVAVSAVATLWSPRMKEPACR